MFQSIINLFKGTSANKTAEQWHEWYKSASPKQKKEQLKVFDKALYDWTIEAEKYVVENQINEIVDSAVYNYIKKNYIIPLIQNSIEENHANNPNQLLLEIEKRKLKEIKEMSWRQALK